MRRAPFKSVRARPAVAALVAALVVASGAWSGASAWASTRTPHGSHHGHRHQAPGRRHHGSRLPVIGHATNLQLEPVVHRSKGKPPKQLEVKDLVVGKGTTVTMASTVSVVYVGANYKTGRDFTQATWTAKHPTAFSLSGVVKGFAEGLVGMKVGGRREIVIPPRLGYGNHNYGVIKANETLVFVVDLKSVSG